MSGRWAGGVIAGLITGITTAWKLGMPLEHLILLVVAVLTIVALVLGAELMDAATRRFQAETDRMVQLGQCSTCGTVPASKPPKVGVTQQKVRWWRCPWRWVGGRGGDRAG